MPKSTCSFEVCDRDAKIKGLCASHYEQQRRGKELTPLEPRLRGSYDERFWQCVQKTDTCWHWTGKLVHGGAKGGYGALSVRNRNILAHRYAYELLVGPIPAGLVIDHLCRNTGCVNPEHLEPVTIGENVLRGTSYYAVNARKTHCLRGHEYTPENTLRTGKNKTGRECRTCRTMRKRGLL
jgi:hypothetical protein